MEKSLKSNLLYLLLGTLVVLLTGAFLLLVSLDMRWMATFALLLSSSTSYWFNKTESKRIAIINSLLFAIPFSVFFALVIHKDLPSLWFLIPLFFISSLTGNWHAIWNNSLKWKLITANLLLVIIAIYSIPIFVGNDLTKFVKQEVESYKLIDHEGKHISSQELDGKVVVLDFYGTWCKPCIAELPEMALVRDHFLDNPNVEFFIVNADQGGDNLDKAKKFAEKFDLVFKFIYDHDQETYTKLGLASAGVPSIVIIDSDGFVRLKHIGYNKSETDFVDTMILNINKILDL